MNHIILYEMPNFKHSKIYPVNECDLCCNISIINICPLLNCDYKMCPVCWNKIINDSNKCPACRRILPNPKIKCVDKLETMCILYCRKKTILNIIFLILIIYLLLVLIVFFAM